MVTHPTTNLPACGLSTAERTGSPVLHTLWSYVLIYSRQEFIWRAPVTQNAKVEIRLDSVQYKLNAPFLLQPLFPNFKVYLLPIHQHLS